MTAEIAVMNSRGVALAADSAVTIGRGAKIYNSANKLFSVSKYHPVGIMIYGNANFLNMPWETIIKVYRNNLSDRYFNTLKEYAEDFLSFIVNNEYAEISSEESKTRFVLNTLESLVTGLNKKFIQIAKDKVNEIGDENYTHEEIQQLISDKIDTKIENKLFKLEKKNYINGFSEVDYTALHDEYGEKVERMIQVHFENFLIHDEWINKIKYIVLESILKEFSPGKSGIVFAGFGEKELFPSLYSYNIEGKINGKLKFNKSKGRTIGKGSTAAIMPFAQSDMVHTFVTGIDRDIEELSDTYLNDLFKYLPEMLVDQLKENLNDETDIDKLRNNIESALNSVYNNYNNEIQNYKREYFTDPLLEIVHSLPKEELADIAEALVNLTSFKKKVTSTLESVGGPTDVAVITKGDGFIWIKRKHYFDFEKNRQFFEKYYWRNENESDNSREKY